MFSSNIFSNNLKQAIGRSIFLVVFLPSISVFAATPAAPDDASTQVALVSEPSTHQQSNHSNTQRVFKDDYERHLITVTKPRSTKMIWLGQKSQAGADTEAPSQAKQIWLRQQNRAD